MRRAWGVVLAIVTSASGGCGTGPDVDTDEEAGGRITEAVTVAAAVSDSDSTLGFETPAAWTVVGGTATATSARTQGVAALAVANPKQVSFTATSSPVASTATALAGLTSPGAAVLLDVDLPTEIGNTKVQAFLQLFVSSKSRKVNNAYLGMVRFETARLGTYRTVRFAIPEAIRSQLTAAPFSDLNFDFKMILPGPVAGTFRLDNLRVRSFGTPVPGPGQSVDLVAQLTTAGVNTPGSASFTAGIVQVPQSFHVKLGSAGTGTTQLVLGSGGAVLVTCSYGGSADGTSYDLTSCTGGFLAGDLVGADQATLRIVSAGPDGAKIRAQLALNPVGDLVGEGIIPPMPTWWGECVELQTPICVGSACGGCDSSNASKIVTDYFKLVAQNPPIGSTVKTPRGEFARRSSDGSPHDNLTGPPPPHDNLTGPPPPHDNLTGPPPPNDNLTGPPPPNDPPFDQEGHLNPGGIWDAYWRLAGNLSSTVDPATNNTHNFASAALSAHAVLWGSDQDIASIAVEAFTDSGQLTENGIGTSGFTAQNSGGSLTLKLFGATLSGGETIPTGGSFDFAPAPMTQDFDLPPIPIWIFSITLGLHAEIGAELTGNVNPFSLAVALTPSAAVGAHIEGDINLGIASGGVSAEIDLLKVSTPVSARANAFINTAPAGAPNGCRIGESASVNGELQLSTLGGEVDLAATFGVCPFCYSDSWTLFSWDGVTLPSQTLFDLHPTLPSFSLPRSLCNVELDAFIDSPVSAVSVPYGIPFSLRSHAFRGPTPGVAQTPINCGQSLFGTFNGSYNWATTDVNDRFADPTNITKPGPSTGCTPLITFARDQSTRTLTLNVIDQFGESGFAQLPINIVPPPPGPNPFISDPISTDNTTPVTIDGESEFTINVGSRVPLVHLAGGEFNGALPVTLKWTVTSTPVNGREDRVDLGAGTTMTQNDGNGTTIYSSVDWQPVTRSDTYTVMLTATDSGGIMRSKSITAHVILGPN